MSLRKTPLKMTGIVLQILRNWFATNDDDYAYIFNNPVSSSITIEPAYNFLPENCQNRPGVFIRRASYQPFGGQRAGINDVLAVHHNSVDYLTMPRCTVHINCVSKFAAQADHLAEAVYDPLVALSPIIKHDFAFHDFFVTNVSPVEKIEEYKDFYTVTVVLETKFDEKWNLKEAAPVLRKVVVDAYTKLNSEYSSGYSDKEYSGGDYGTT